MAFPETFPTNSSILTLQSSNDRNCSRKPQSGRDLTTNLHYLQLYKNVNRVVLDYDLVVNKGEGGEWRWCGVEEGWLRHHNHEEIDVGDGGRKKEGDGHGVISGFATRIWAGSGCQYKRKHS